MAAAKKTRKQTSHPPLC